MKNSGNSLYDRHQNFSIWPFRSWEIKAQRCLPSLKIMTILDTLKFRHPVLCVLRHEKFDIWSIILRIRLQQYYKNSKYLRRELSWTMVGVWPVGIYRMSQNCSVSPSPTHQTYPPTPNFSHLKFDLQTRMRGQNSNILHMKYFCQNSEEINNI